MELERSFRSLRRNSAREIPTSITAGSPNLRDRRIGYKAHSAIAGPAKSTDPDGPNVDSRRIYLERRLKTEWNSIGRRRILAIGRTRAATSDRHARAISSMNSPNRKSTRSRIFAPAIVIAGLAVATNGRASDPLDTPYKQIIPSNTETFINKLMKFSDDHPAPWIKNRYYDARYWLIYRNEGDRLEQAGYHEAAIRAYELSVGFKPDEPVTHANLGQARANLGLLIPAIRDYSRAIHLDHDYAVAYARRGLAYSSLDKYDRAIEDFNDALKRNPTDAKTHYNRGIAYTRIHQDDRAIADFDEAIGENPRFEAAYLNRGMAHARLGRHRRAISDYEAALRLKPDDARAHEAAAQAYAVVGEPDRALIEANQAVEIAPDDIYAYGTRAVIAMILDRPRQAIDDFNEVVRLAPESADPYYNRALAFAAAGEVDKAIADYTKAIELAGDHWRALGNRGLLFAKLGRHEAAIGDFTAALANRPGDPIDLANRARSLAAVGRYAQAIEDYNIILNKRPDDSDAHINRGDLYMSIGKNTDAIADYSAAIKLTPESPLAIDRKACASFLIDPLSAYQNARAYLVMRHWRDPRSQAMVLVAALSARQLNDEAKAAAILQEAVVNCDPAVWPYPIIRYLGRDLSAKDLIESSGSNARQTEARAVVGLDETFQGNSRDALEQLRWVNRYGDPSSPMKRIALTEEKILSERRGSRSTGDQ